MNLRSAGLWGLGLELDHEPQECRPLKPESECKHLGRENLNLKCKPLEHKPLEPGLEFRPPERKPLWSWSWDVCLWRMIL